jgi:hypothetical protein
MTTALWILDLQQLVRQRQTYWALAIPTAALASALADIGRVRFEPGQSCLKATRMHQPASGAGMN